MRRDNDTLRKGAEPPFEPWEGDHTALVHVLWAAKHDGLTLADDCDEIASMVLRSRFLAARIDQAVNDALRRAQEVTQQPSEAAAAQAELAASYEAEAAAIRQRLATEPLASDDANLLDHNASTLERLARGLRESGGK